MNIVDPILFQARLNPEGLAICTPGTVRSTVSYGQLVHLMNNIARRAIWEGLKSGDTAAIFVKDKIFHSAIILALTRLGIITVSGRSIPFPRELKTDAVISDGVRSVADGAKLIVVNPEWMEGDGKPMSDGRVYQGAADDVCRIVLTSGSTGDAKGVAFTHRMITERNNRYLYIKGDRFSHSSRLFCDLGLASNPGFRFLVYMLTKGGTIFFYGDSPESTLQAFGLYRIQNMFISTSGLAEYLKFFEAHSEFPCDFDHITTGGSVISKSMAQRVRARMSPLLYSAYGATEACTMALAPLHAIEDTPGAVGWMTPDVTIDIVDESDRPVPHGKEGIVRVRSPYVVKQYVGDPPGGRYALRNGYFYPGDIGYLTEERLLVVLGRDNLVLNVGGDKVAPEIVENVIGSFPRINDVAVFTHANELGIPELYALIASHEPIDEKALLSHCGQRLERGFIPRHFVRVEKIPRNDAGKIERHRLAEVGKA